MLRFLRVWIRGEILLLMIVGLIAICMMAVQTFSDDTPVSTSLLDNIDTISQNPEALRAKLEEAVKLAKEHQQKIDAQMKSLQERIELLHQSLPGIQNLDSNNPISKIEVSNNDFSGSELIPMPLEKQQSFFTRFTNDIYPLLNSGGGNCYSCHATENKSELRFLEDQGQTFLRMLVQQYFDPSNPMSLITRIESKVDKVVMPPPPMKPWSAEKIQTLRQFSEDITAEFGEIDQPYDEQFPMELMEEYDQEVDTEDANTTFLSYYQLKNKIETIFQDDWMRNGKDRFQENIALFSGADFYTRFNESDEPTAQYLTGLDLLGADVASKAYLNQSGPYQNLPHSFVSPLHINQPNEAYQQGINQIYQKMLYRLANEREMEQSFALIRSVHEKHQPENDGNYRLDFEVTVEGDAGVKTVRNLGIDVINSPHTLYQSKLDLNTGHNDRIAESALERTFHFRVNDKGQAVEVSNYGTREWVSFAGVVIEGPLPKTEKQFFGADDIAASISGPWDIDTKDGLLVLQDENEHKGECSVRIPITVKEDGEYKIYIKWFQPTRRNKKTALATNCLVNVNSYDETRLIKDDIPNTPPKGEAHFIIDQTVDTIAFWDLNTSFQFAQDDYVEINNKDTKKRVTADAVQFEPASGGESFLVDDYDADGVDKWHKFTEYAFRPYNTTGDRTVNDRIENKGELWIRYKPSVKKDEWNVDEFYKVGVGFPGQARNETHVPVVVKAKASSPIVQYVYPKTVPLDALVEIDASSSYDTQGSELKFTWRQIGGPQVEIDDPHSPVITFKAKHRVAKQAGWEALVRALIRHPDFMFTRPFALDQFHEEQIKERLLLVKVAQDLVGRPPLATESAQLSDGKTVADMIDYYLATDEFEDFYFHRIRLYLESQGKEDEDEPVRIWCYIAFHDRPFKEILTADYTVTENWEKKDRPAYYGNSGILTTAGFIKGKPGLPHFNYAAQVAEKFLGYVFEVPAEIVDQRDGVTAASTTSPDGACYSCHKLLTPLALQRLHWTDDGKYRSHDAKGLPIDHSDQDLVPWYPFKGEGMESFAMSAQHKERFIRTIIDTHFLFFTGREMRFEHDERELYQQLWTNVHEHDFKIKQLIKAIMLSPEYQGDHHDQLATASISQTN